MNNRQFLTLVIITFIVGMVWLVADIIFNTKASVPISDKLQTLLEPVNPTFNNRVLDIIDQETLDRGAVSISNVDTRPSPSPSEAAVPEAPAAPEASSAGEINQ